MSDRCELLLNAINAISAANARVEGVSFGNEVVDALASYGVGSGWFNVYDSASHVFFAPRDRFLIDSSQSDENVRKMQRKHFSSDRYRLAQSSHRVAIELYIQNLMLQIAVTMEAGDFPPHDVVGIELKQILDEKRHARLFEIVRARLPILCDKARREWDAHQSGNRDRLFPMPHTIVWVEERLATMICYEVLESLEDFHKRRQSKDNARPTQFRHLIDKIKKYHFIQYVSKTRLDWTAVYSSINVFLSVIAPTQEAPLLAAADNGSKWVAGVQATYDVVNEAYRLGAIDLDQSMGVTERLDEVTRCRAEAIMGTGWGSLLIVPIIVDGHFHGCFLGEPLFEMDHPAHHEFLQGLPYLRMLLDTISQPVLLQPKVEREVGFYRRASAYSIRSPNEGNLENLVGNSDWIRELREKIARLARTEHEVLLTGATGVGKDLIAKHLHAASDRREGPFVVLDLATVADNLIESELYGHEKFAFTTAEESREGLFQKADGGTLVLNEVQNLSLQQQQQLLDVLERRVVRKVGGNVEKPVNVRVICVANMKLIELVESGKIREDLYYRLKKIVVTIEPLKEHAGDIPYLVVHFLSKYRPSVNERNLDTHLSTQALSRLMEHEWKGNVRELKNAIDSCHFHSDGEMIEEVHVAAALKDP